MRRSNSIRSAIRSAHLPQQPEKKAEAQKERRPAELELARTEAKLRSEELKQVRSQLEEMHARFAAVYDHAPVACVMFDSRGTIRDLNFTMAELLNRPRKLLLHFPFSSLVRFTDKKLFLEHMVRCRGLADHPVSTNLRMKAGKKRAVPVQMISVPVQFSGQKLFFTTLIDLSGRVKTLEETQSYAESIVATVREPLIVLDADLKVVSVNSAFTQTFKKSNDSARGQHLEILLNVWWRGNKLREELQRVLLQNIALDDFPLEAEIAGVGRRSFLINARRMNQKEEGPTLILAAFDDITARKEAEEKLQQSQSRLAEAQHLAHIGSWEWDMERNEIAWTEELHRIFGTNAADFIATSEAYLERIHPDDREMVRRFIGKAREDKTPFEFYHRTAGTGENQRILHCRGQVQTDASGKAIRMFGTAQDVTEQKIAESELQRLNQDLENRVVKRTESLQESHRQMEAFCYSIAHDLRAPLRAMKGFSEVLAEDYAPQLGEEGQDYVNRIRVAATRMDQLIQDLLDYGRLQTAELPITQIDTEMALQDVLAQMESDIQKKEAVVKRKGKLPNVRGHILVLQTALTNLISNALKFVAPGVTPKIEIWGETIDNRLRIWVADNGIGISPEYQKKIFEIFQRLHTNQDYPGTGIGLALVSRGLERTGGRAGVQSEPGRGSRFWIEFPL